MIRVAYIGVKGLPARSGAERVLEGLARRLPGLGVQMTVYCDADYTSQDTVIEDVELVRLRTLRGKHTRSLGLALRGTMASLARRRFDLVHLHNVESAFVIPLLRLRYPVVSTSHGAAYSRAKWGRMAKWAIQKTEWPFARFSNICTCVSAVDAAYFRSKFRIMPEYIPNGVEPMMRADMAAAREILGRESLAPGNFVLFVAGRVDPTKGAHLLLEAHRNLESRPAVLILGELDHAAGYEQELKRRAAAEVKFHPLIRDPSVLYGIMRSCKLLVFPSTVEAMSMVLLEAGALAVPVLASDIPENLAVLGDEGSYFRSGDVDALRAALCDALSGDKRLAVAAERVGARIRREHAWDAIAGRYAEVYRRALGA